MVMDIQAVAAGSEIQNTQMVNNNAIVSSEDFFKLLVAQIQNQDPTDPMDPSQTITQMSQISASQASMEVKNIAGQISAQSQIKLANDMIGKYVEYVSSDEGEKEVGRVDSVVMRDNNLQVIVNGKEIYPGRISAIAEEQQHLQNQNDKSSESDL